jgi:hypothetical protein
LFLLTSATAEAPSSADDRKKRKDRPEGGSGDAPVRMAGLPWARPGGGRQGEASEDEADGAGGGGEAPRLRIVEENRRAAEQLRASLQAAAAGGADIPSEEQIQRLKARREQASLPPMSAQRARPGPRPSPASRASSSLTAYVQ